MLKILIDYLNSKLANTGYINSVLCIAEKISKEAIGFPAIYNNNNEFQRIEYDANGSVSYWKRNGEITYSEQENTTKVGQIEYTTSIPLRLILFIKKDTANNDAYFSDRLVDEIKSILASNTAVLNGVLKAKKVNISAVRYNTNGKEISDSEFDGINYEPRYTHAYFSIDFDIKIVSNQNCYLQICDTEYTLPDAPLPIIFCNKVATCLGISDNGSDTKFLNEKGEWITVESGTLTCNNLSDCQTIIDINTSLNNKVDKIIGKGLSTEDYTTAEKSKLASITEIFTTALKNTYDSAVSWISTNGTNLINHLSNTSNPHSVTATQVDALKRDGSNANSDIDIDGYMLNGKAFHVKGTNGNGHIGFKHQASNITAVANESSLGADSSGNPQWKNDGGAVDSLELQSNKTSTVTGNETSIVKYLTVKGVYDWVLSLGYLLASTASSTYQTLANLSTDLTASATKYPSVNAVNTGLSNKVDKNASITGATKTKITYDSKGLVTSGADATTSDIADSASARYVTDAQIAAWNALIGGSIFQSVWNATTNNPTLVSSTGTKGYYYIVSVAGSTNLDGITDWKVGDWAIFDGTVWRKVDNTDAVSSVNSLTGAVSLDTSNVPDTSNKRYVTDANLVVIGNTSGTNSGNETTATLGATINGASAATPNDTDLVATVDTSVVKKITWTNVKAFLKTYFDTIYTTTSAVATQITTALSGYLTSSTAASTYSTLAQYNIYTGAATTQSRLRSAATGLTTGTSANVTATALTLGAGTWDISAMVGYLTGTTPQTNTLFAAVSQTSATLPATDTDCVPNSNGEVRVEVLWAANTALVSSSTHAVVIPTYRVVLAGSTTFYLLARAVFGTSTMSAFGSISARQVK